MNGTIAKNIVIRFVERSQLDNTTSRQFAYWINMAKDLLLTYEERDILNVIEHLTRTKKQSLYSFGYIVKAMESALMEIEAIQRKEEVNATMQKIASSLKGVREEVNVDEQSAERNRAKASRFGVQPWFREEYPIDLHEKS